MRIRSKKKVLRKKRKYVRRKPTKKKLERKVHVLSEATKRARDLGYFYKDLNDKWIILELFEDTNVGELYYQIENDIITIFGQDVDYFIPVFSEKVNDKNASVTLFDGYLFIKDHTNLQDSLGKMKSEYIKGAMLASSGYQYISNAEINGFKKKLDKKIKNMIPAKGQRVTPRVGTFRNMEGKVVSVNKKTLVARVLFEKASRVVEAPIKVVNLEIN